MGIESSSEAGVMYDMSYLSAWARDVQCARDPYITLTRPNNLIHQFIIDSTIRDAIEVYPLQLFDGKCMSLLRRHEGIWQQGSSIGASHYWD